MYWEVGKYSHIPAEIIKITIANNFDTVTDALNINNTR